MLDFCLITCFFFKFCFYLFVLSFNTQKEKGEKESIRLLIPLVWTSVVGF